MAVKLAPSQCQQTPKRRKDLTFDLVSSRLGHLGRGAPVVDSREEVDGAFVDIDLMHTVSCVKATEIEVQVAVEDACLLVSEPGRPLVQ
jgi:hypothetical protein